MFSIRVSMSMGLAMLVALALIALMQSLVAVCQAPVLAVKASNLPEVVSLPTANTEQTQHKPLQPQPVQEAPQRYQVVDPLTAQDDSWKSMAATNLPVAIEIEAPTVSVNYMPVYVPEARFPKAAIRKGLGGFAVVKLIIAESGAVRQVELVQEEPRELGFGQAALKAAERMRYNPKLVDGKPVEVRDVFYKYNFAKPERR